MSALEEKIAWLKKHYRKAVLAIIAKLESETDVKTLEAYQKELKEVVDKQNKDLNTVAANWSQEAVPIAYELGVKDTNKALNQAGLSVATFKIAEILKGTPKQTIHVKALGAQIDEASMLLQESNYYYARQIYDNIRNVSVELVDKKLSESQTIRQLRKNLVEKFKAEGIKSVKTKDGRLLNIESYAEMVARSTTAETTNLGTINQLIDNGHDLVQMSEHSPTCGICAMYQGRVYSLTGQDKRFPKLHTTAFASGYANIHPGCAHRVMPYIVSMKSDEEIKGDVERSNAPFEDTRSLAEKKKYDAIQKDKRQRRADRLQYERYKHRLGSENVPKSFSGFRRMKISGSKNWGVMEAQYKGMGYYNKALANEPQITNTVKDIADTVDMKPSGLEFRIKGKDSYLRKIRSEYSERGNNFEIKDILRYTYVDDAKTMSDKTLNSIEEYGKLGYNTVEIKNYWLKPDIAYNGVNTVISSPDGQKFELQYHTPHSFDIKNGKMHKLYEEYRLLEDRNCEYAVNLRDEMNRLNKGLVPPKDIDKVK